MFPGHKKTLWRWVIGTTCIIAIDLLAILCDPDQFDGNTYSVKEEIIGFVGHITFFLDLPFLAIHWLIDGDPWSTIGFHLPFSIVAISDKLTYSVCRGFEDICICFGLFLLWQGILLLRNLLRKVATDISP